MERHYYDASPLHTLLSTPRTASMTRSRSTRQLMAATLNDVDVRCAARLDAGIELPAAAEFYAQLLRLTAAMKTVA